MTLASTRTIAHRDLELGENQASLRTIMTAPPMSAAAHAAAAGVQVGRTPSLLPVEPERVNSRIEHWLDLVTSNEITGPDAHWAALRNFDQLDAHPGDGEEGEEVGEDEGCGMGMA